MSLHSKVKTKKPLTFIELTALIKSAQKSANKDSQFRTTKKGKVKKEYMLKDHKGYYIL